VGFIYFSLRNHLAEPGTPCRFQSGSGLICSFVNSRRLSILTHSHIFFTATTADLRNASPTWSVASLYPNWNRLQRCRLPISSHRQVFPCLLGMVRVLYVRNRAAANHLTVMFIHGTEARCIPRHSLEYRSPQSCYTPGWNPCLTFVHPQIPKVGVAPIG
jgi:hypothetical protein